MIMNSSITSRSILLLQRQSNATIRRNSLLAIQPKSLHTIIQPTPYTNTVRNNAILVSSLHVSSLCSSSSSTTNNTINSASSSSSSSSSTIHKKTSLALSNSSNSSKKKNDLVKNGSSKRSSGIKSKNTLLSLSSLGQEDIPAVAVTTSNESDMATTTAATPTNNIPNDVHLPPPPPPQQQQQQQQTKTSNFRMDKPQNYLLNEFAPRICVVGVGGAGGNAINNMISRNLIGVDFLAINTDAQHLRTTLTENQLQIGKDVTNGLGCGANPDAGRLAAEESRDAILEHIHGANMVFLTAGMGGGTGTGATPILAELCYEHQILTVAVVTKPFRFEGTHRMRIAEEGLIRLKSVVDTLIVVPNQNLFSMATDSTSLMDAFGLADDVLLAGVKSVTDLMTSPGLINLDFADVQSVMSGMGNAMLGTGQSSSTNTEERALEAAVQAISNPLLGDMDISTAKGMLVNITGGSDMTLFEVDKAAQKVTECLKDANANIIFGSAYDASLEGSVRVSIVATGIDEDSVKG